MDDELTTPRQSGRAGGSGRRVGLWVTLAAVVLVVLVGGIVFAVMPRGDAPAPAGSAGAVGTESTPSSTSGSTDSGQASASPSADQPDANANPFPEQDPVGPRDEGSADGISARLVNFESVEGEVVGSGDVARPAVRVTVDITNTGSTPLDLDLVVLNAYMGAQRDPAETYEQPGGSPVSGSLEPGATATGIYLFRIPEDRRDDVTIVLDYRAGQPAITFRGSLS